MSCLTTYLAYEYPDQMKATGLYRSEHSKQIQDYLEFYQNILRPCVKQMIRFTLTRQKAGLTEMRIDTEESKDGKDEEAEVGESCKDHESHEDHEQGDKGKAEEC